MGSRELAERIEEILEDKKGGDIVVMALAGVSDLADYFIFVTATGTPHLKALEQEVEILLKRGGLHVYRRSGTPDSGWLILDYVHVVVHFMTAEVREYYAVEKLFSKSAPVEE